MSDLFETEQKTVHINSSFLPLLTALLTFIIE